MSEASNTPSVPDIDALIQTVRKALPKSHVSAVRDYAPGHPALLALDSLAAEIERLKAERDEAVSGIIAQAAKRQDIELLEVRTRLDKALVALRAMMPGKLVPEYEYMTNAAYHACVKIARRVIAEIEGEAEPLAPDPRLIKRLSADGTEIKEGK